MHSNGGLFVFGKAKVKLGGAEQSRLTGNKPVRFTGMEDKRHGTKRIVRRRRKKEKGRTV